MESEEKGKKLLKTDNQTFSMELNDNGVSNKGILSEKNGSAFKVKWRGEEEFYVIGVTSKELNRITDP